MIHYSYQNPEPPLDPPEDKIICNCTECGGEIFEGEQYYAHPDGSPVCSDCLDMMWWDLSDNQKASLLGLDII